MERRRNLKLIWFSESTSVLLTVSNVPEIDGRLNGNTYEEANTLIILRAIDVAQLNSFQHIRIISPDTVVLLLLIHYYPQLPVMVLFESDGHKINISAAYEVQEPEKSNEFLGVHVLSGSDQTSTFNEKTNATCWKAFLDAGEDMLATFAGLGVTDDLADLTVTSLEKCGALVL